ncbi:MAG: GNAT family N-acetyltransferase [Sedimenticola sp.]
MIIREAIPEDATALIQLFNALDRETDFMLFEPDERDISPARQKELIESFASTSSQLLMVAEQDRKLVGFIGAQGGSAIRNRHSTLIAMGVLEAFWGQSIGRQLLEAQEAWAKTHGFHRLELTVQVRNKRARRLYEKCGFIYEGTKRDALKIDGDYVDECYMSKLI